jgi:hypothetical protein
MRSQDSRGEDWKRLCPLLRGLLLQAGNESPYGEGDFWIVDDDWGGHLHKVCVYRIGFITRMLVDEVPVLARDFPDWGVMFQLEIKGAPGEFPQKDLSSTRTASKKPGTRTGSSGTSGRSSYSACPAEIGLRNPLPMHDAALCDRRRGCSPSGAGSGG